MALQTTHVMTPAVVFQGVFKSFPGMLAVCGLNLTIPAGCLYVLLGANGAGKTTSLRMITGLEQPDTGTVTVFGLDVQQEPRRVKQKIAFLPDEPLLYGLLKPLEYLTFVAGLWGVTSAVAERRTEELMKLLNLWEHNGKLIHTLSRGMQQKLALIGALIHDPSLIILDEPLTGLDIRSARQVKDIILNAVQQGTTVILTTHIMEIAEPLADQIGIINAGKLIAEGSLTQLQGLAKTNGTLEEVFLKLVDSVAC